MQINTSKTACIRIGARHHAPVANISINNSTLTWNQELNYLGIVIASSKRFTVNQQKLKQKFFRNLNAILGKVGVKSSLCVLSSLVEKCCIPCLLYGSESVKWNSSMMKSCENAYAQFFYKVFHTFDKSIVASCQFLGRADDNRNDLW